MRKVTDGFSCAWFSFLFEDERPGSSEVFMLLRFEERPAEINRCCGVITVANLSQVDMAGKVSVWTDVDFD